MVSIRQIKNFLILAEVLHFAKAASQLKISQATLSCEIKKMEHTLGVQLFDRSDKWAIKLTAAGQSYYEGIKNIPADIAKAQENALKSARGNTGSLSVAVSSVAYDYINIGSICKKMAECYPEVKIKILDMPFARNRFDCLCHGKADVAIFAGNNKLVMPENFTAKSLLSLKVALAVPRKSRLADIKNLTIEDLKNVQFVLPSAEEAPNLRHDWDKIFMEHCHCLPTVTHEVAGFHGTLQFVAAGIGAGFLFMRKHNIYPDKVVLRELPVEMNRSLFAGYREHNPPPVVKNFLRILCENTEEI